MISRLGLLAILLSLPLLPRAADAHDTRLLRETTVSSDLIAFAHAGDIWVVAGGGGRASRITSTPGVEAELPFSPDGVLLAFTATVAGNTDVYVVPVRGGTPTRLTFHPGVDRVRGWTADGGAVLFGSGGTSAPLPHLKLWRPPLDGSAMGFFAQRDGKEVPSPLGAIYGSKVMPINETAGSGGHALPYFFRLRGLGPLVGTRTWGGLVGTLLIPPTVDGGEITAPSLAFYDHDGRWAVENEGVPPDIHVPYTPAEVLDGGDPQLERGVEEALRLLEAAPDPLVPPPVPIDRLSRPGGGEGPDEDEGPGGNGAQGGPR